MVLYLLHIGIFWNNSNDTTKVQGEFKTFRYYHSILTEEQIYNNYSCCLNNISTLDDFANEYTQIEYIQSTGSQFIELDYIPKSLHTKYVLDFMRLQNNGNWNPIVNNEEDVRFGILCSTTSTSEGAAHIGLPNNHKGVIYPISNNTKYHFELDKTGLLVNDTKYEITDVPEAVGQWSACINHRRSSNTGYAVEYSIGRWYGLKIYEDDVLIKSFIPVKRTFNNTICMYETIENKFYNNKGTGSFVAGPEV